ncbi:MAG: hypothetical protein P8Y95_10980, partial [Gammaproteobacteria bacterium]
APWISTERCIISRLDATSAFDWEGAAEARRLAHELPQASCGGAIVVDAPDAKSDARRRGRVRTLSRNKMHRAVSRRAGLWNEPMSIRIQGIGHCAIRVADLDATERF